MDEKRWESINFAKIIEAKNRYGFTLTFMGTDENVETHRRFVKFCQAYDGVFISGIRALLDDFEMNRNYLELHKRLDEQDMLIFELREELEAVKKQPEKKPTLKTFGKEE